LLGLGCDVGPLPLFRRILERPPVGAFKSSGTIGPRFPTVGETSKPALESEGFRVRLRMKGQIFVLRGVTTLGLEVGELAVT